MPRSPSILYSKAFAGEAAVLAVFALIALGSAALWWRGQVPFPFLSTDLANISSYAAALVYPDRFAGDIAIGNPKNFRFYVALHVPLLMWLGPYVGDFGSAALLLLPLAIFIQTSGYYVLGRVLFPWRAAAIFVAVVSLGKIDLTVDYLGTYTNAEPRFFFQALLPWLLAAAIRWGPSPGAWPWIMMAAGLLIYVHPVSAPTVGLATWLGLWAYRPQGLDRWEQLVRLSFAGGSFLVVCLPFLWLYLGSREYGSTDDYTSMFEAQRRLIGPIFFDVSLYLHRLTENWTVWLLIAWGVAGAVIVGRERTSGEKAVLFFALWAAGILLGSIGIAAIEQILSRAYGVLPAGIDLVRNVRYLGVMLIVFGTWGTCCVLCRLAPQRKVLALSLVALVFLAIYRPGPIPIRQTLQCWAQGKFLCSPKEWGDEVATLHFLRDRMPPRTRVLAVLQLYVDIGFEMAIRYHALQPMVFNPKDAGSTLSYGNWEGLRQWLAIEAHPARHPPSGANRLAYAMELARATAASVLVTDLLPDPEVPEAKLLFTKGRFHIYQVDASVVPVTGQRS